MADNSTVSITTLNVNGLNAPIKRQRWPESIFLNDPTVCFFTRNPF